MTAVGEAWQAGMRDPAELARQVKLPRYEGRSGYDEWLPLSVERAWAFYHIGW